MILRPRREQRKNQDEEEGTTEHSRQRWHVQWPGSRERRGRGRGREWGEQETVAFNASPRGRVWGSSQSGQSGQGVAGRGREAGDLWGQFCWSASPALMKPPASERAVERPEQRWRKGCVGPRWEGPTQDHGPAAGRCALVCQAAPGSPGRPLRQPPPALQAPSDMRVCCCRGPVPVSRGVAPQTRDPAGAGGEVGVLLQREAEAHRRER